MPNTMAKSKKNAKTQTHVFRGIRDIVLNDARGTVVSTVLTNTSGVASINGGIHPQVMTCPQSIAGGTTGAVDTVLFPRLQWLYSTARNFQSYRILRAVLIFVGNIGSTSSGTVNMAASRDISDMYNLQTAYVIGPDSKSFDLAVTASKEIKMQMPVDTSWKKITSLLATYGNSGLNGTQYSVIPLNTVNDLAASFFSVQVVGAAVSTNIGTVFIEYDVEFRDPISLGINV